MKISLIAPKNPESFWTFDRILPSLGKKCLFPNLSLPTVSGLTPREHEVVLCDENVAGMIGRVRQRRPFDLRRAVPIHPGGPHPDLDDRDAQRRAEDPSPPAPEGAGRLIAESVGDQFVFTNIIPQGMTRVELYEGYKTLLERLYGYRNSGASCS